MKILEECRIQVSYKVTSMVYTYSNYIRKMWTCGDVERKILNAPMPYMCVFYVEQNCKKKSQKPNRKDHTRPAIRNNTF